MGKSLKYLTAGHYDMSLETGILILILISCFIFQALCGTKNVAFASVSSLLLGEYWSFLLLYRKFSMEVEEANSSKSLAYPVITSDDHIKIKTELRETDILFRFVLYRRKERSTIPTYFVNIVKIFSLAQLTVVNFVHIKKPFPVFTKFG